MVDVIWSDRVRVYHAAQQAYQVPESHYSMCLSYLTGRFHLRGYLHRTCVGVQERVRASVSNLGLDLLRKGAAG